MKQKLYELAKTNIVLLGFIAIVLALSLREPSLISLENITQVLRQGSIAAIIAVGVTFVVIAGRLDLSVGSLLTLCVVMGIYLHDKIGPAWALVAMLAIGLGAGIVNGTLIALLGLNSLITTLGMLSILQGVSFVLLDGHSPIIFRPEDTWFGIFGRSYIYGVPTPVVILVATVAGMAFLLGKSTFGRSIYAVGGNETASAYSSIDAKKIVFLAYVISGVLTAVAAIVLASRVMSGQNNTGSGYEITVLSGIILGGTSLLGGQGNVVKSVIGVLMLGFIGNSLSMLGLPYLFQWIITWAIIVIAVWVELAFVRGRVLA